MERTRRWCRRQSSSQQTPARDIPGGFAGLRSSGIDEIELRIQGDSVTLLIDGSEAASRPIIDRVELTDREGSGPFKGRRQVLVLGTEPLAMGDLVIDEPVIWPGSFDDSPVITLKPRDPEERGPDVRCGADEACLLLTSGADPNGSYENANNPELNENPIATIEVASTFIELTLDTGRQVRISRTDQSSTRACGLAETEVWDVPPEIDLAMDDPVLVHTVCPSTPGNAIQLTIIARTAIPTLAPLGSETGRRLVLGESHLLVVRSDLTPQPGELGSCRRRDHLAAAILATARFPNRGLRRRR